LHTLSSWFTTVSAIWLQIGIVGVWLGTIGVLAEWLYRSKRVESEVTRKIVHIGVGNVILFAWWLGIPAWVGITASVLFSAIAFLSYHVPILPGINGVGRKSLGTFFYAISIGVLIAWFWTDRHLHLAVLGVLVMTWGDGLAALIGQRFGRHPYKLWEMQKSWEGSFTMGFVSFIVSSLILLSVQGSLWQTWVVALIVALVATALELFSRYGIDNLTVPVGSAAVCFVLERWLDLG
jgi:phytol kinase